MAVELGFEEAERLLLEAEFEDCRPVWYSSNGVYVASLRTAADEQIATIYKPRRGENPLWDFPEGTLYLREAAAYHLSRLLGWAFIPPTVVRDGPNGVGSVQVYVQHDPDSNFFTQREDPALVPQLQRMAVFDVIANNADRKGGHCLLDADRRIWGIDQGLCFHEQYKLRSVIWDWVDEPVPEEWLKDVEAAAVCIESCSAEAQPLLVLLGAREQPALLRRMERLLKERRFPPPGEGRHYPWPLV